MSTYRRLRNWQTAGVLGACGLVAACGSRFLIEPARAQTVKARVSEAGDDGPLTDDQKILHILNRIGYGPRPGDVERVRAIGIAAYIDQQLHPERISDTAVDAKLAGFQMLTLSGDTLAQMYYERNAAAKQAQLVQREMTKDAPSAAAGGPAMDGGAAAPAAATQSGMPQMTAAAGAGQGQGKYLEEMENATPAEREQMRQARQALIAKQLPISQADGQLFTAKTVRAVESQRQLQEVMVDFWGNHFNIDTRKGPCSTLKVADDRDVIRPFALGKFRDLLGASAKSPAMLFYLDNFQSTSAQPAPQRRRFAAAGAAPGAVQQPRRGGLNENYGREVMELHTLGVDGGYTQKDVTEVARCFTGWGLKRVANSDPTTSAKQRFQIGGAFEFHPYLHDRAEKSVLGHRIAAGGGIEDGEQVLDILASSPATMQHVSYELCQRFVADKPPVSLVNKCVATWQRTDGDIREIMRTILASPEFYSRTAYRQKLKSPFEYAVSAVRALGGSYDFSAAAQAVRARPGKNPYALANPNTLVGQVSTMGQPIFQYQAPTGYPEDSHKWRSTGALISRLNFSLALSYGKLTEVKFPDNDEDVVGLKGTSQIVNRLANEILHGDISSSTRDVILREASEDAAPSAATSVAAASDLNLLRRATALMLGSPEFQRR